METVAPLAPSLPAALFWETLPPTAFDAEAIDHLLRRAGWAVDPKERERVKAEGLERTLERWFPGQPVQLEVPPLLQEFQREWPDLAEKARGLDGLEKREQQRVLRERSDAALRQMSLEWLDAARQPEGAPREKWHLFLSDVYVVGHKKVRNAALLRAHEEILRAHAWGPSPALTKAVSRSPAMIQYLDLQDSRKEAPNENFARELFELFLLGQGNYTETDIREAARAFTGYRHRQGQFHFAAKQTDNGRKTVFGRAGPWTGDDVIDLAYAQPAAGRFLPAEMVRFYLSHRPLPQEYLEALAVNWRNEQFNLRALVKRFFGCRGFYAPEFRGNSIKSPVQFYLGMLVDLDLDVLPLPRPVLGALRQMGQELWEPPNVRGWVGGPQWINSATLAARLSAAQTLFEPLGEAQLNADDRREIERLRERGRRLFRYEAPAGVGPAELLGRLFCPSVARSYRSVLTAAENKRERGPAPLTLSLLQSPGYQLC